MSDENAKTPKTPNDRPPPTWDDEIKHFFTQMDAGCMRNAGSKFDLANYEHVKRKSGAILNRVRRPHGAPGQMPKNAHRWTDAKIARFDLWVKNDCPKAAEMEGSDVA